MLDVRFMKKDESPKSLYNPTRDDFSTTMSDDTNKIHIYTVHAGELVTYPAYIANHVAKKLAHHILGERGIKTNYHDDLQKILTEEVEVRI